MLVDLASRRVVGWFADARLDPTLTWRAPHYASAAYHQMLAAHGMTSSVSRVGDCWDAAVVEASCDA